MSKHFLSCAVACAMTMTFVSAIRADENFTPPKLGDFQGKTWGKLELGRTTQDGIKRDFRNGRGDFRNSVELKTSSDLPYKVIALFPTVKKEATLDGIVIRYKNDKDQGLPFDALQTALGNDQMKRSYPSVRHDDWSVVVWPSRGIAAFLIRDQAAWVLLGEPAKVAGIVSGLGAEAPSITEVPDAAVEKKKEAVFGTVSADFSLTRMDVNKSREKSTLERDLRRPLSNDSILRYDRGTEGSYTLSVSATNHDDKDGSGSVSASFNGVSPYGKISLYESESFTVRKQTRHLEDTDYFRAVERVQRTIEDKARKALDKQGPPSPEDARRATWEQLVESYRRGSGGNGGNGGLL